MKISPTQYATTLFELTQDKNKSEVDSVTKKFINMLAKNNQLKMTEKIIQKFIEFYNQKNGIVEAEVTTREKISTEVSIKISNYVSNKYKAKEVVIKNKIDENIKGGIIIKVGDEILDGSVAGKLRSLEILLSK
jgi:F-type H+-transporting ATPase subunit delta